MSKLEKAKSLLICIAIPLLIGGISGYLTADSIEIYKNLRQPSFSPPGWVFGPVWTVLYILMGYASYMVWKRKGQFEVSGALIYYGIQLVFNFFWPLIFFRFQLRGLAFLEILILLALIVITTVKFYKIDKYAAYMLFPYIGWVGFATILNYSVWILNR